MARCQSKRYQPDYQIVNPHNAHMYQRSAGGYLIRCSNAAEVHVRLEFSDGMVVERDLCPACAAAWQTDVRNRSAHWQPAWTITPLTVVEAVA